MPKRRLSPVVSQTLLQGELSLTRAALAVSGVTVVLTLAGAWIVRFFDKEDYPTFGRAVWWSLQTLTTVGYGDVVPQQAVGKVVGAVVMVSGVALVAVITAIITAAFVEGVRRRRNIEATGMSEVVERLAAIEAALDIRRDG